MATGRRKIALVLAGGGARGAYEYGVLRDLLPWLARQLKPEDGWPPDIDPQTWRPHIVVGTSVGALNAAHLAATANEPLEQALDDGCKVWEQITWGKVLANLVSLSSVRAGLSTLFDFVGVPRFRPGRLLDPSPLRTTLAHGPLTDGRTGGIPFERIHANVKAHPQLETAAVVSTLAATSLSRVFHTSRSARPKDNARRGIAYKQTDIGIDHILASAAIPSIFPPVYIEAEQAWYYDGGTRLNTPIKPAIDLGATHLIVIALHSPLLGETSGEDQRPVLIDGAKQLIQGLLIDPLVNDLHTVTDINEIVAANPRGEVVLPPAPPARPEPKVYRQIPYIFIHPRHEAIGAAAHEVFAQHYGDVWDRRHNVALMGQALDVDTDPSRGELLSYLFFDSHFGSRLVELGRADASAWIDRVERDELPLWQTGPPAL